MAVPSTLYCTQAQVENYLSPRAVNEFSDHDNDGLGDSDVVNECIYEAVDEINDWLCARHTVAQLATSDTITRWCVKLSAYHLTLRRGNPVPESIEREFFRITDPITGLLQMVAKGIRPLCDIPNRYDPRVFMSNITWDRRYSQEQNRVQRRSSSAVDTELTQNFLDEDYYHP